MSKRIWLALLAACVAISVIASRVQTSDGEISGRVPPVEKPASQASTSVPDYIVYGFLFRNVSSNNQRNQEHLAKGLTKRKYFPLKREVDLTEEQARALTEIAADCEFEVKEQDKKARTIIGEFRAKLPTSKDAPLPPPPPELKSMWDERNASILRARDRLHAVLGEDTFARLDNFAKFRYGTNKAPVLLRPIRSDSE